MLRSTALTLLASAAVLLATTGCVFDDIDHPATLAAGLSSDAEPAAGHEAYRMFEAEKRNATMSELPVQF